MKKNKKSSNPFRMSLSYIGAIIFPILFLGYEFSTKAVGNESDPVVEFLLYPVNFILSFFNYTLILEFMTLIITGFILGWVIQILLRKLPVKNIDRI